MVRVGITGCDNLRAAELVRILINHPDVELVWVESTGCAGMRLDEVVPGIVGECGLTLSRKGELDEVDLVFTCGPSEQLASTLNWLRLPDGTRVIDLSGCHNLDYHEDGLWQYGLSEMQRRILVHDTHRVTVPSNAAMISLLALLPLARNQLLNRQLALSVSMGALAFHVNGRTIDGLDLDGWADVQRQEVEMALKQCQPNFDKPVTLTISSHPDRRTIAVETQFECELDGQQIRQLYDQYFDDHNFVFIVDRPIATVDVENTSKCLIYLNKDEHAGVITIQAMMDLLIKGSAGNAVHMMNLMFGLHERVGLTLKGTGC